MSHSGDEKLTIYKYKVTWLLTKIEKVCLVALDRLRDLLLASCKLLDVPRHSGLDTC